MTSFLCESPIVRHLLETKSEILEAWFGQCYGPNNDQEARYGRAVQAFEARYGLGPVAILRAPARINLIGEHIDYVSYFQSRVLPLGSREHDMLLLMRPRTDKTIRVTSTAEGMEPAQFSFESTPPDDWLEYLQGKGIPSHQWSNYIRGAAFYLQHLYPTKELCGADLLIDSTIPLAGGASSSSALVVTSGAAFRLCNQIELDAAEIAEASSEAEWYVGTRGGKMDHATLCYCEQEHALRITFEPFSAEPVAMPVEGYRWVTFYTHPAEKGDAVMSEYNERSLVSRFLIPWLLEGTEWSELHVALEQGIPDLVRACQSQMELVISRLPESMTLQQAAERYPNRLAGLSALYPALFAVKGMDLPLKIQDRARHHLGEILRVLDACECLHAAVAASSGADRDAMMRKLGDLLTETHASLRDFYEISTPDLEAVVDALLDCDGVYGARVMGGGFGGNVLALVRHTDVSAVIERVAQVYYRPQGRRTEGNVMVSSPGRGLEVVPIPEMVNQQRIAWANDWQHWETHETQLLASCPQLHRPVRPIIVAAGKGERARKSGLDVPKPLAPIRGKPVVRYVAELLLSQPVRWEAPIVVVNSADAPLIQEALQGIEVEYVIQSAPLGTGHAVWETRELLKGFTGDALVIWGTQPVVLPKSILAMLHVHQATQASMTFPTTKREHPYAPIARNAEGFVMNSVETHQEGAKGVEFGEDNIGVFCVRTPDLLTALSALNSECFDPESGRYATSSGELGFPNQMVRALTGMKRLILALALADPREAQGIKTRSDLDVVETYLRDLLGEGRGD